MESSLSLALFVFGLVAETGVADPGGFAMAFQPLKVPALRQGPSLLAPLSSSLPHHQRLNLRHWGHELGLAGRPRPLQRRQLSAGKGPGCSMKSAALVYDERHSIHNAGGHPEKKERASGIWETLTKEGLVDRCCVVQGREATDEELLGVHDEAHVRAVSSGEAMMDASTYFNPETSPLAARVAAGCVTEMMEKVMAGEARNGFCVVRPPGHHAVRTHAMGFCVFNNVAVAARKAQRELGAKRVLIFDWDVHHGNGVQDIFYQDPDVLYISVHRGGLEQSYFFPATGTVNKVGEGPGRGYTVNIPLENPMGYTSDAIYDLAMLWLVTPIAKAFQPDLVMVSAGFDAADGDPLGGFALRPGVFARMTKAMMDVAPPGKLVLALEGGYNVPVTAECVAACVRVLLGDAPPPAAIAGPHEDVYEEDLKRLRQIASVHREFWPQVSADPPVMHV